MGRFLHSATLEKVADDAPPARHALPLRPLADVPATSTLYFHARSSRMFLLLPRSLLADVPATSTLRYFCFAYFPTAPLAPTFCQTPLP